MKRSPSCRMRAAKTPQALADSRYQLGACWLAAARPGPKPSRHTARRSRIKRSSPSKMPTGPSTAPSSRGFETTSRMLQKNLGNARRGGSDASRRRSSCLPLWSKSRSASRAQMAICPCLQQSGLVAASTGRTDEAGTHLRTAQGLLKTLAAEFPDVPQYPLELASVEYNLGLLAAKTLHPDQAIGVIQGISATSRRPQRSLSGIARLPYEAGRLASRPRARSLPRRLRPKPKASLQKALNEQSALLAEYPGVPEYQRMVGRSHYQLALLLLMSKNPPRRCSRPKRPRNSTRRSFEIRPDSEPDQVTLLEDQITARSAH